jgi:phosphoribosylaminoimidazolecarboxamide formyltransferase/IMP cyclohydrolase
MLDGRVKTLHPKVHGGLLARRDVPEHMEAMKRLRHRADRPAGVEPVPVRGDDREARLHAGGRDREHRHRRPGDGALRRQELEAFVAVVTDAGRNTSRCGWRSAANGKHVGQDALRRWPSPPSTASATTTPRSATTFVRGRGHQPVLAPGQANGRFVKLQDLRYGENPHQQPRSTATCTRARLAGDGEQLQGKELSYNNIADADAAWEACRNSMSRRA